LFSEIGSGKLKYRTLELGICVYSLSQVLREGGAVLGFYCVCLNNAVLLFNCVSNVPVAAEHQQRAEPPAARKDFDPLTPYLLPMFLHLRQLTN
jgi:hypothetical protein